jgi:DNA-binding GntR family transcriptional regulator
MSESLPETPQPLTSSRVVTTVFDNVLAAVQEGRLQPGARISDGDLAEQFGVSRTPVREALQRLREIGIVEASASRFTRIAVVTPRQTAEAMLPTVYDKLVRGMRRDHEAFLKGVEKRDLQGLATANLSFFSHLAGASANATLQRAITSVVHIVRLGSLHLPAQIDFEALATSQRLLIDAAAARDLPLAIEALTVLEGITIPQDE